MKCSILMLTVVVCVAGVYADYDFIIEDGFNSRFLYDSETLLMTGGGGGALALYDYSFARIEGTSPLQDGYGGIWTLNMAGESRLEFYGGEVHQLSIATYATAMLAGGRIDRIGSYQDAWQYGGDPPELLPNPHITIVGDLDSVNHDAQTNVLTGKWLDGTAFNIQLLDVAGYSPAIENIRFIPEPTTLLLVLGGAVLMRKRCRSKS